MSRTEQAVEIMAKLYEARRGMRSLFGDEFDQKIKQWREALREIQKAHNVDILTAGMHYLKIAQENNASGATQAMIMAAIVEESESAKP